MSDLPEELVVEEIFSRLSLTSLRSVRSTCKEWNALSKNWIFGKKAEAKNQFLGFMTNSETIFSVRIDFQGICKDGNDFIDVSIKHVENVGEVYKAYCCDGLLFLRFLRGSKLVVWNPYLGQTKFIPPAPTLTGSFALGYDNSRNHKILHITDYVYRQNEFNIYEFSSDSWRVLNFTPSWKILSDTRCVTLKGNAAYFFAFEGRKKKEYILVCFDFTLERFGPRLSLPFQCYRNCFHQVILSLVRDEQLAMLYQPCTTREIIEIWVTNKIDYNEILWTKWMRVDTSPHVDFGINIFGGSFFIDEKKKIAVVLSFGMKDGGFTYYHTAHVIGQDGYYYKCISFGGDFGYQVQPNLFGYSPSLYQIE